MHIIKNLLVPMILAMGLWGCSENSDAFFASHQNKKRYTPSYFYNEFLSCTTGPDYSEANLKTITAKFNTLNSLKLSGSEVMYRLKEKIEIKMDG